ncbi:spindle and centriole-associated protein 1 isoform X1 [Cyprinodon tularosa]|uniref:spindle and centriole-associated protein 1 isoform X1 n=1 Tax=Cyprinodon tularosa TaxID=77115 RepID=UPI0018E1EC01|nr:spindle and centriole-associated protein 1 isoform X1 [Cyprinodon tularosa]
MSLVRKGPQQQQQLAKGKRAVRPKKTAAPRKDWVGTVNDLSVHKLTPAELSHRHEMHRSHNKAAAQWELREKALWRRFRHAGSPAPLDQASLSIIREVFSDQLLLQDVLDRSDRAIAVVKDLFGDAPRRQTGHPTVTVAPNCDSDSEPPVFHKPDPPTQLSLLSQSMMDQTALNEVDVSREDDRDENTDPSCNSESRVIRRAYVRKMKSQGRVTKKHKGHHLRSHPGDKENVPVTPVSSGRAPSLTALNATAAVQRHLSKQPPSHQDKQEAAVLVSQVLNPELPLNQSERISKRTEKTRKCVSGTLELDGSSVASLSGDRSTLGLLQEMLGQVKADLDSLSPDTAPESAGGLEPHRRRGLTGFSVALVSTLGRLVHLLREREAEAEKDANERRGLLDELKEQRGLIDALTAETMTLREEAAASQAALQQRTADLEQKLDSVVLLMGGLGLLGDQMIPVKDSEESLSQSNAFQSPPGVERPPEKTQTSVSPAVLLSPPRQSDNWQHSPGNPGLPVQRYLPPSDIQRSYEDVQSHLSTSTLPSASSSSLLSYQPHFLPSAEAMLAEIAELKRQNDLIKAQLSQAKILGSGVTGLPSSSSEQSKSSPVSIGRVTPQSAAESRRPRSGSSSRGQHPPSPEERSSTSQAGSSSSLSVEQRLLELNRQSAAARSRLLELIEQQKQSSLVRVSPSASPIPASAFSPNSAGTSPEETAFRSHRRSAGSMSSNSAGFERQTGGNEMEKQREREGWFSLSAHTR